MIAVLSQELVTALPASTLEYIYGQAEMATNRSIMTRSASRTFGVLRQVS